jgi:hypothetical protein
MYFEQIEHNNKTKETLKQIMSFNDINIIDIVIKYKILFEQYENYKKFMDYVFGEDKDKEFINDVMFYTLQIVNGYQYKGKKYKMLFDTDSDYYNIIINFFDMLGTEVLNKNLNNIKQDRCLIVSDVLKNYLENISTEDLSLLFKYDIYDILNKRMNIKIKLDYRPRTIQNCSMIDLIRFIRCEETSFSIIESIRLIMVKENDFLLQIFYSNPY